VRNEQSCRRLLDLLRDVPTQRLRFIVGDYTTKPGALTLTTFLNANAQRGLNHVVSIHGEKHHHAAVGDITGRDFLDTMSTKVLPHIVVAQAAVEHVVDRKESSYTIVTGRMGQRCEKSDEALLCIANAASYGVASALRAQCRDHGAKARIPELRIGCVVKRDQAYDNPAFPGWQAHNASTVARFWARHVAGDPGAEEVIQCTEEQLGVLPQKAQQHSQQQQQQQGGKVGQQQQQQRQGGGEIRVQEA
jgi:NAD(P)-dependent dehydrogenase (short-subunit alcohol dehydrogenase family)